MNFVDDANTYTNVIFQYFIYTFLSLFTANSLSYSFDVFHSIGFECADGKKLNFNFRLKYFA